MSFLEGVDTTVADSIPDLDVAVLAGAGVDGSIGAVGHLISNGITNWVLP